MRIAYFFLIFYSLIYNSYQRKYGCNDLTYKGGYFYEAESGDLANGELKCIEDYNNISGYYEDYANYKDGVKVGKWTYLESNDTIQHGVIFVNTKLNDLLSQKFNAKYISLEISNEGDIIEFNFCVYEPKKVLDSIQIQDIVNTDLRKFMIRNRVNEANVYILNKDGYWRNNNSYKSTE